MVTGLKTLALNLLLSKDSSFVGAESNGVFEFKEVWCDGSKDR